MERQPIFSSYRNFNSFPFSRLQDNNCDDGLSFSYVVSERCVTSEGGKKNNGSCVYIIVQIYVLGS